MKTPPPPPAAPRLLWERHPDYDLEFVTTDKIEVTLEPRRPGCDRGNYYAKVFPKKGFELEIHIDESDGFPRYYFDQTRAKLELEAWLERRGLI